MLGVYILQDWSDHEYSLVHQHVRDGQSLRVYDFVPEDGNVEIDVSRALVDQLDSSMALFDGLKTIQKFDGTQRRFDLRLVSMALCYRLQMNELTSHAPLTNRS